MNEEVRLASYPNCLWIAGSVASKGKKTPYRLRKFKNDITVIPEDEKTHPIFYGISMFLYGSVFAPGENLLYYKAKNSLKICVGQPLEHWDWKVLEPLDIQVRIFELVLHAANHYKIKVTKLLGYGSIKIPIFLHEKEFSLLVPNKQKKLRVEQISQCGICNSFFIKDFSKHQQSCSRCDDCMTVYRCSKEEHLVSCSKIAQCFSSKSKQRMKCKKIPKEKEELSLKNSHYADFETFFNHSLAKSECYSAVISDSSSEPSFFLGPHTLDYFFMWLKNKKGTLWFHNGSKFDNLFLYEYARTHPIPITINEKRTVVTSTQVLCLCFITDEGEIEIKDLYKFCASSLAQIAKDMGLDKDLQKTDFDHSLITCFEDAEKYRKEIELYNIQDVKVLRAIHKKLALAFWNAYSVNIDEYVTLPHLAVNAWSMTLPDSIQKKLHNSPSFIELQAREAYRGGRIVCGRPLWFSKEFEYILQHRKLVNDHYEISDEAYQQIQSFCRYADANSLYPFVMQRMEHENIGDASLRQRFPLGKPVLVNMDMGVCCYGYSKEDKEEMTRSVYKVDFIPPKDLAIPFLMTRTLQKECIQSLSLPGSAHWFTGPELIIAQEIGYQITSWKRRITWPQSEAIFADFIEKAYTERLKHPGGSVENLMYKLLMNGLTGKFAQRHVADTLITTPVYPGQHYVCLSEDFTPLYEEKKDTSFSKYPLQLSIFILAYSRIEMWKNLERMNVTKDENAIIYGDTDSYILDDYAWQRFPKECISTKLKEIGAMKEEIDGKIIRVVVNAPKFYMFEYITASLPHRILCTVRCKGIPHTGDEYPAMITQYSPIQQIVIDRILDFKAKEKRNMELRTKGLPHRDNGIPNFFVNLKEHKFIKLETTKGDSKEIIYVSKIPSHYFLLIQQGLCEATAYFGSLDRKVGIIDAAETSIRSNYKTRQMVVNPWWEKGFKLLPKGWKWGDPTFPKGHYKVDRKAISIKDIPIPEVLLQ